MKDIYIPRLVNYFPDDRKGILEGQMPANADSGPWRAITEKDKPHPFHVLGMLATKEEFVPVRLYGTGKEKPKSCETAAIEGVDFDLKTWAAQIDLPLIKTQSLTTS